MKVQNITDIDKFFKVIDSCKGKVELVTGEGDRLNLKSKLSQYVSLANILSNGEIPELEVIAYEKEDIDKIVNFMGRNAGYIALWCGIANGAEDILLPEKYDYDEQTLINHIIFNRKRGKKHHIIINAEGIGHSTSMRSVKRFCRFNRSRALGLCQASLSSSAV